MVRLGCLGCQVPRARVQIQCVTRLVALAIASVACGKSEAEKQAEQAAEDIKKAAEAVTAGAGQQGGDTAKGMADMAKAMQGMAAAIGGGGSGDGKPVEPVSTDVLKAHAADGRRLDDGRARGRAHDLADRVLAGRNRLQEGRRRNRDAGRRHRLRADADRAVVDVPGLGLQPREPATATRSRSASAATRASRSGTRVQSAAS